MKKLLQMLIVLCVFVIFPLSTVGMNNGSVKSENTKGGIPDQVAQLEEQVRSLTELVTNQQQLIESIQQQLVAQTEAIKVNGYKISQLSTDTEQHKEKLSTYMNQNDNNIENLFTDITTIENRVGTNQHAISGLHGNFNYLSARLQIVVDLLEGTPAEVYTMSGQAVFMDGTPIRETLFHLYQGQVKKSSGHTNYNGNFTIRNISDGNYMLKIGNESNPFVQMEIEVNGENVNGLLLQSSAVVYSVEGKALFANDLPILSYGIYYTGDNGVSGSIGSVQSDGSFNLTVPAGKYTVQFGSKTHPLAEEEIEVVGNIESLEVRSNLEAVTVSGKMVDSNDKPFTFSHSMKDLSKNLEYANLKSFQGEVGQFVYYLPKNSTYTFNIRHNGYQLSNQTLTVEGEDMEGVKFQLTHPTYSLSGKVVDSNGDGINKKAIHIRYPGGMYSGPGWRTDENGDFLLDGLAPGEYELIIGDSSNPNLIKLLSITDQNLSNLVLVGN